MICGGRYWRSKRSNRGAKSVIRTFEPFVVGEDRLDDRRIADIARLGLNQPSEHDVAEALLLVAGEKT